MNWSKLNAGTLMCSPDMVTTYQIVKWRSSGVLTYSAYLLEPDAWALLGSWENAQEAMDVARLHFEHRQLA